MSNASEDHAGSAAQSLTLNVSPDRLAIHYHGPAPTNADDTLCNEILAELTVLGVPVVPSRETLLARIQAALADGAPLVEGQAPVPSQDGILNWAGDFFSQGFLVDEKTGSVDFRQRAAQLSVTDGQLLLTVVPPVDGVAGMDVFGKPIPVPRGKVRRVRTGPNVRLDDSSATYYAAASGRIRWNGELLSVDPVFEVPGSVGLATGHIVHPGALVVGKDIESGSKVRAAGEIEVKGAVEGADVECGGDLSITGGLTNGEGRLVRSGGKAHARFVRDAHIEAEGDIFIEKESIQSTLKTRGAVIMPRGRIIGGEVTALRGIEVCDAGTAAGIHTTLVAGEDFARAAEMEMLHKRLAEMEMAQARIRHALDLAATSAIKLSPEQFQAMLALEIKAEEAEEEIRELRERVRKGTETFPPGHPRIIIHGCLYPETVLRIGCERYNTSDAIKGPITALVAGGGIILIPADMTPS
ncbi:MAG: FapA family protein [FCB group bacterium]|jgi:uncharacterized protein (DUF342 family)|nr:FapA family protein [FCB group bacterium]